MKFVSLMPVQNNGISWQVISHSLLVSKFVLLMYCNFIHITSHQCTAILNDSITSVFKLLYGVAVNNFCKESFTLGRFCTIRSSGKHFCRIASVLIESNKLKYQQSYQIMTFVPFKNDLSSAMIGTLYTTCNKEVKINILLKNISLVNCFLQLKYETSLILYDGCIINNIRQGQICILNSQILL